MQYKIPVQIENEDIIVANLSLRQIGIIMGFWGVAFTIFKQVEPNLGANIALFLAAPIAVIGIIIGLWKVSEMTFLPFLLNRIRLSLNARDRLWSKGTDGFPEIEIGYIVRYDASAQKSGLQKADISTLLAEDTEDRLSRL